MNKSNFLNSTNFQLLLTDEDNFRQIIRTFANKTINNRTKQNKSLYAIVKFYNDSYNKTINYIINNIINNNYPIYIINEFINYLT